MQAHLRSAAGLGFDGRRRPGMPVANPHGRVETLVRLGRVPDGGIDLELLDDQVFSFADDDAGGFRVDIDHVARAGAAAGQSLALADGEHLDALVWAEVGAPLVADAARMKFAFAEM